MSNKSPSYDEGWQVVVRELSDIPNWEKLTYANGVIEERLIPKTQLELFAFAEPESELNPSLTDFVSDTEVIVKEQYLTPEVGGAPPGVINEYSPGKRKVAYFRFSYRDGSRVKHKHIRGGNTGSQAGRANADKIRDMIARRESLSEILNAIALL